MNENTVAWALAHASNSNDLRRGLKPTLQPTLQPARQRIAFLLAIPALLLALGCQADPIRLDESGGKGSSRSAFKWGGDRRDVDQKFLDRVAKDPFPNASAAGIGFPNDGGWTN